MIRRLICQNLDEVHTKNGVKMGSYIFTHDIVGVKRPWKEIILFGLLTTMIGPLVIFKCSLNVYSSTFYYLTN